MMSSPIEDSPESPLGVEHPRPPRVTELPMSDAEYIELFTRLLWRPPREETPEQPYKFPSDMDFPLPTPVQLYKLAWCDNMVCRDPKCGARGGLACQRPAYTDRWGEMEEDTSINLRTVLWSPSVSTLDGDPSFHEDQHQEVTKSILRVAIKVIADHCVDDTCDVCSDNVPMLLSGGHCYHLREDFVIMRYKYVLRNLSVKSILHVVICYAFSRGCLEIKQEFIEYAIGLLAYLEQQDDPRKGLYHMLQPGDEMFIPHLLGIVKQRSHYHFMRYGGI